MEKIFNLYFEDLVGNLFITLMENGYNTNKISYNLINEYQEILSKNLKENKITPVSKLSRDYTQKFLEDNKGLYSECDEKYIELMHNLTIKTLVNLYRGYLSLDVLRVIKSEKVNKETIEAYEKEKNNLLLSETDTNGIQRKRIK